MLIYVLLFACLYILGTYLNSYSKLYKELNAVKAETPQYNFIIFSGSESTTQDKLIKIKNLLINTSVNLENVYDEVQNKLTENFKIYADKFENDSETSLDTKQTLTFTNSEENLQEKSRPKAEEVFAQNYKCVGTKCKLGFFNENLQKPLENAIPSKIITPSEKQDINIIKENNANSLSSHKGNNLNEDPWKHFGVKDYVIPYSIHILSFASDKKTLPFIVILMFTSSVLVYNYIWSKDKSRYVKSISNVYATEGLLKSIVQNLQDISIEQENICRLDIVTKYSETAAALQGQIQKIEDYTLTEALESEEKIMCLMTNENNKLYETYFNINKHEMKNRQNVTQKKQHSQKLPKKKSLHFLKSIDKLSAADKAIICFRRDFESRLTLSVKEDAFLEELRKAREVLQNSKQHPLFTQGDAAGSEVF